jgi:hypothetical protein
MKSDVFSFGVILIEIITGRRVTPSSDIPEWVSNIYELDRNINFAIISSRTSLYIIASIV